MHRDGSASTLTVILSERAAEAWAQCSRMKPCRAAETSATASGKSTRIASRSAIACSSDAAGRLHLLQRRRGQLDRRVQRQGRELLALGLLHRFGLLLGELAEALEQILWIAAEEREATFAARR